MPSISERFHSQYEPVTESGCWLWTGRTHYSGYGVFRPTKQKQVTAHRMSWALHRGEIPDGMCICHTCDVRCCVNPDHLFLGTADDNMKDMVKKNRAACGNDLPFSKLSPEQVREIRELAKTSTISGLSRRYGVARVVIRAAIHRKTWKHVA